MEYAALVGGSDVVSQSEAVAHPHPCGPLRQAGAALHPEGVYDPYCIPPVAGEYQAAAKGASQEGDPASVSAAAEAAILARWRGNEGGAVRRGYTAPHGEYRLTASVGVRVEGLDDDFDEDL